MPFLVFPTGHALVDVSGEVASGFVFEKGRVAVKESEVAAAASILVRFHDAVVAHDEAEADALQAPAKKLKAEK